MQQQFEARVDPAAAFAFFANPERAFELFGPQFSVTWDGPIAAGTAFHVDTPNPTDRTDGVVEVFDPPHALAYRMWVKDHPDRGGEVTMTFEPTATGTRVRSATETRMTGALQVGAHLIRPWLAMRARQGTKRLIAALEAEAATTSSPT
jgi:uncharacterized protein YndB with AHSA1/START domain